MKGCVVAVVAHPDDESLIAGGTLALAARAGARTGVVALTRGEHGPISEDVPIPRERLAQTRAAELRRAAAVLGVHWAHCLRYPDGELPWVEHEAAADELAAVLEPHRPVAVLTFGDDGLYGHPDHAAARDIAVLALRRLQSRAAVYEAAWPYGMVTALAAAAAAEGHPADLWGLEAEAFGCEREPTIVLDVRPVLAEKLAALRAHRTQIGPGHLLAALPLALAERFLDREPWAGPQDGPLQELLERG